MQRYCLGHHTKLGLVCGEWRKNQLMEGQDSDSLCDSRIGRGDVPSRSDKEKTHQMIKIYFILVTHWVSSGWQCLGLPSQLVGQWDLITSLLNGLAPISRGSTDLIMWMQSKSTQYIVKEGYKLLIKMLPNP